MKIKHEILLLLSLFPIASWSQNGSALEFDGVSQYMRIPSNEALNPGAGGTYSVSCWVNLPNYRDNMRFISKRSFDGTANSATTGYELWGGNSYNNAYSVNISLAGKPWGNGHAFNRGIQTSTWTHLCWVFDGPNKISKVFINGNPGDTKTVNEFATKSMANNFDVLVGCGYTNVDGEASKTGYFFKGKIDNVRFYNKALSSEEVVNDKTATVDATTEGLVAAYDFESISGLTVPDISGNGHNGTLVNYEAAVVQHTIQILDPQNGSLTVKQNETPVTNGSKVEEQTTLTIEATPDFGFALKQILVDDQPYDETTIVITSDTKISAEFEALPGFERTLVFGMNEGGAKFHRIPGLVTAADGSLIAVADKRWNALNDLPGHIDVMVRRSEDNGKTWSEAKVIAGENTETGYGDPAIVLDKKTGHLVCIYASHNGLWQSNKANRIRINVSKSTDHGLTWSAPNDITDQIYQNNWYGAFAASGRALQLRDGRIMFVVAARLTSNWGGALSNYACYSDDGGETWSVSENAAESNGDEAKLVELNNGDVLMSIRNRDKGNRKFCISKDKGVTWGRSYEHQSFPDPACNGDIIRYTSTKDGYEKDRLLHSMPDHNSIRQNVSIWVSYDEGETWDVKKLICNKYSAYSSITILKDGSIGMLVEEGKWDSSLPGEDGFNLYFVRFPLSWVTDGKDEYKDPIPTKVMNKKEQDLTVYPNPFDDYITIEGNESDNLFQIYDIAGQTVYSGELASNQTTINLSHLNQGTYFLHLTDRDKCMNFKLIKQ